MKLTLLLAGFLLITFGRHAESRYHSNWEDELSEELDRMSDRLEADAERRENEAEARADWLEAQADAREKLLEAQAEVREKQLEAQIEAKEKQFQAALDEIRRKCAEKGFIDDTQGYSNRITYTNSIDGFQHIYVQIYNPVTKKVSGSYYRINLNDPKAEPICRKLDV